MCGCEQDCGGEHVQAEGRGSSAVAATRPRQIACSTWGLLQPWLLANTSQLTASSSVAAGDAIQLKAITLKAPHKDASGQTGWRNVGDAGRRDA